MTAATARRLALAAALGAATSWSVPARAADPAAAQALFDQARKLMLDERCHRAERRDPARHHRHRDLLDRVPRRDDQGPREVTPMRRGAER